METHSPGQHGRQIGGEGDGRQTTETNRPVSPPSIRIDDQQVCHTGDDDHSLHRAKGDCVRKPSHTPGEDVVSAFNNRAARLVTLITNNGLEKEASFCRDFLHTSSPDIVASTCAATHLQTSEPKNVHKPDANSRGPMPFLESNIQFQQPLDFIVHVFCFLVNQFLNLYYNKLRDKVSFIRSPFGDGL